jgi:asparagine synthase (glutamine-hydrolysing)
MCGIVGIVQRPGHPVDPTVLDRMAAAIRHRGPDDEGRLVDGAVGLGHQRLSIIDLVTGHQPMTIDGVSVVYNGEIYNYIELRDELRALGHRFSTTSDTEVLLRAYIEWGTGFVERLNGMFAFVVHDPEAGRILAARDRFGVKPLYVHATAEHVLLASEVKAFLPYPDFRPEPDQDALRDYLTFQFVPGSATLFRGVAKVLPGHAVAIDLASLAVRDSTYWQPDFRVDLDHTERYFVEELRRLVEDSVRLQMRSDVPVGAHLSGGVDSSLVTVLASRLAGGPFKTFTGAFDEGPEFDESAYAREVASACGAACYEVRPTQDQFVEDLPLLAWHMDEPAAGPGLFPQYRVSRLAREEVKVVLGGQGGDEVFGGYARYVVAYLEQALKGAICRTTEEGEHIVSLSSILPNLPFLRAYVPMMREFWSAGAFEPMDRRYFHLIDRSGGSLDLFSGDFRGSFDREGTFARFQAVFNDPDTKSYYNKMTHFDLVASLPALLQVEDRTSMACSLESRVPLLDHRVVDLVTTMPPALKFKGAEMKYALKMALGHVLPPSILARKDKMGFPVPLHLWAKGRARDFFRDVLLSRACRGRGLFDAGAVERLLDGEAAFGRRLWGLLNLELWHRRFIDEGRSGV